jgi:hypothetical protein
MQPSYGQPMATLCPGRLVVHMDDTHTCPVCAIEHRGVRNAEHRAIATCPGCKNCAPEKSARSA